MKTDHPKNEGTVIPVVFAADRNYLFYACTAISSMAKSAGPGTFYRVYLLTDRLFSDPDRLLEKTQERHSNLRIETVCVDDRLFRRVSIRNPHLTKATFYRLALCGLIPEERCLYLDSDVLVTEDLGPLFSAGTDGCYLAGCRDLWIDFMPEKEREERRIETGLPSMDSYINAGVLLLDLKKIRSDGIDRRFLACLDQSYPHEDQDILNICCYGRIRMLPAKWNLLTVLMGWIDHARTQVSPEVLRDYQARSGIIHYATPWIRPWGHRRYWACDEWWQAALEWQDEPVFQEILEKTEAWENDLSRQNEASHYIYLDERYYLREFRDLLEKEGNPDGFSFVRKERDPDAALSRIRRILRSDPAYQDWIKTYHMQYWLLKETL